MTAEKRKNTLEKCLSLFSTVNEGEGGTVFLLFINAFIMMLLYYILKPVREGLCPTHRPTRGDGESTKAILSPRI